MSILFIFHIKTYSEKSAATTKTILLFVSKRPYNTKFL